MIVHIYYIYILVLKILPTEIFAYALEPFAPFDFVKLRRL